MSIPTPPPLHMQLSHAIKAGDLLTLRGLLRNHSDWLRLLGVDQVVDLPYGVACDGKWEIFELLLSHGFGRRNGRLSGKLIAGICNANVSESEMLSRVDDLLMRGADAGPPNPGLNLAAIRGYVSVVERLVNAGADVDDLAYDGFSALQNVAWRSRISGNMDNRR
ncbi:MAG: ankyrin repeat domain-containing protein, partial [Fibrella sp.]|nr:ankyrin repeat domain-containing protein [Armatimonadota bacterium]